MGNKKELREIFGAEATDKLYDVEKDQISDPRVIENAVKRAFIDFTSRTLVKIVDNAKVDESLRKIATQQLVKQIQEYIQSKETVTSELFDKKHEEFCMSFIKNYNLALNNSFKDIAYGKAQKIVNMTFKYLYCYDNSSEYEDKFKFCHMPLDSFTLNWFWTVVVKKWNEGKARKGKIKKSQIVAWSNLEQGAEEVVVDADVALSYNCIQKLIKDYLTEFGNNYNDNKTEDTVLEAEFYIWRAERRNATIKEFNKIVKDLLEFKSKNEIIELINKN